MKELKKQVDEEIRREILAGRLEVPTATQKKTNMTTINDQKDFSKKEFLNISAVDKKMFKYQNSKGEISVAFHKKKRKSKSKENPPKNISLKIKKFIEKKKKLQNAAKSLE